MTRRVFAVVVMAHGLSQPNVPRGWIAGLEERAVGYEDLDTLLPDPSQSVAGKSVLVLGAGNAAYETVDSLRNWAADLQVCACFHLVRDCITS